MSVQVMGKGRVERKQMENGKWRAVVPAAYRAKEQCRNNSQRCSPAKHAALE